MVGFDDAAMMGLGVVNAGVQIAGQQYQKRQQKKLTRIQKASDKRNFDSQMKELGLQQEDVNRSAEYNRQDIGENMMDQQGPGGSYAQHLKGRNEGERSRRFDALERQKTMLKADWLDAQRARSIQKKMAKNQRTMSMISSMLLQGGSGVAGMMGGQTAAGG